jgi:ATP-dependent DNA helicase Q1
MCDFCKKENDTNQTTKVNCIKEANLIIEILSESDKKFTANKLAEVAYSKINAKTKKKEFENKLNQNDVECLIIEMLSRNYIRQDFHFTPYSTYCYLIVGQLVRELERLNEFELYLKENSDRNGAHSSAKRSAISKKEKQKEEAELGDVKEEIVLSDTEDDPDFEIIETSKKPKYF